MSDATGNTIRNAIPNVAREGGLILATELTFEERQLWLESLDDDERQEAIRRLPDEIRLKWSQEELAHFEELVKDQPVEGAEYGEDPGEQVVIEGAEEPEDRAPDVGAELIKGLVEEKFAAQQRATKAERERDEANAEVNAYYQKFGPLNG